MACLDPEATDRAPDMTRADDADFHLRTRGRLTRRGRRLEDPLEDERCRTGQQRAAPAINGDMIEHRHTNCELQDESSCFSRFPALSCSPHREHYYNAKSGHKEPPGNGARTELIPMLLNFQAQPKASDMALRHELRPFSTARKSIWVRTTERRLSSCLGE